MKKKILSICLASVIAVIAVAGASVAYLTDTDQKDNVFTLGNVDIKLEEDFVNLSKLLPATGSAQNGTLKNGVQKDVKVTNIGTEDAYVRVHIALPSILDSTDATGGAAFNTLHFNYRSTDIGEGKWDWSDKTGAPYEGQWNFYTTTIDGIEYNVYVVTYETALAPDATTESAMHQVYLDSRVTNEVILNVKDKLGENWHMYVAAEGVQADGFDDAYSALNTAFGIPGQYSIDWVTDAAPAETTAP